MTKLTSAVPKLCLDHADFEVGSPGRGGYLFYFNVPGETEAVEAA